MVQGSLFIWEGTGKADMSLQLLDVEIVVDVQGEGAGGSIALILG